MTLYGLVLFVHVVFAILLVGGSAGAHLTSALALRARTVDGVRSHVAWSYAFIKASGPIAATVLLAGLFMAFRGGLWGSGWPVVSLALFALGGAGAFRVMEPKIAGMRDRLASMPDGPATDEVRAGLQDRTLVTVSWVLEGADLAIIYLMTNKPGWSGALLVAAIGLALGAVVGLRESRHAAPSGGVTPTPSMPTA